MEIGKLISRDLVYSDINENLKNITYKMLKNWKRRLPITNKEKLYAVITSMDLINAFYLNISFDLSLAETKIYSDQPYFVYEDESLDNVIETLKKLNIGGLIVVNKDYKPIGVFTEKDVLKFAEIKDKEIKDIMTHKPICLNENHINSAFNILKTIVNTRFRNLPIVNEKFEVKGLVNAEYLLMFIALSNFNKNLFNTFSKESLILRNYATLNENESVKKAVELFVLNEKCDAILITKNKKLTGIITERDILQKAL